MASLAWAKRQWPDQLASFVLHLDEQTVHAHLLVVPRVRSAKGAWKLNSKALFDRERLRELQTSFGEAMAPLGIRRGEPGSTAEHSEVKQFYGAVLASKTMPMRVEVPRPPKPPPPMPVSDRIMNSLTETLGFLSVRERARRDYLAALGEWKSRVRDVQRANAAAWSRMQAAAAASPLLRQQRRPEVPAVDPQQPMTSRPRNGKSAPSL